MADVASKIFDSEENGNDDLQEAPYQLTIKRGFLLLGVWLCVQILFGVVLGVAIATGYVDSDTGGLFDVPVMTAAIILAADIFIVWWVNSDIKKYGVEFGLQIGLKPSRLDARKSAELILLAFVLMQLASYVYSSHIMPLFTDPDAVMGDAEQLFVEAHEAGSVLGLYGMLVVTVFVAPIVEELIFRGYVQSAFLRKSPAWLAITIGAVLFATIHFNLALWPVYFFAGWAMGWVYHRTGSIWAAVALHFINNMVYGLISFLG